MAFSPAYCFNLERSLNYTAHLCSFDAFSGDCDALSLALGAQQLFMAWLEVGFAFVHT